MEEDLFGSDSDDSGGEAGTSEGGNLSIPAAAVVRHDCRIPNPIVNEMDSFVSVHSDNLVKALREGSRDLANQMETLVSAYKRAEYSDAADTASSVAHVTFAALTEHSSWPSASWREAYLHSQVFLAVTALVGCYGKHELGDDKPYLLSLRCMRHVDRAFILGGTNKLLSIFHAIQGPVARHQWSEMLISGEIEFNALDQGLSMPADLGAVPNQRGVPALDPERSVPALTKPSITEFGVKAFGVLNDRLKSPHLLQGVATEENGWGPALEKWKNVDFLVREHGFRLVPIEVGRYPTFAAKDATGVKAGADWSERITSIFDFCVTYMIPSLKNNVEEGVGEGDIYTTLPLSETVGYLAQHSLIEQIKRLKSDFKVPPYCHHYDRSLTKINAWVGTEGTVTPLHYDSYDNFLTQVAGYKYVRLYAPGEGKFLYHDVPGAPKNSAERMRTLQGNISPVRIEDPDLAKHPNFVHATYQEAILGPGDMLFIPAGTWHYVRSLSPAFSLNFWF
jgi:hypothetical protein